MAGKTIVRTGVERGTNEACVRVLFQQNQDHRLLFHAWTSISQIVELWVNLKNDSNCLFFGGGFLGGGDLQISLLP